MDFSALTKWLRGLGKRPSQSSSTAAQNRPAREERSKKKSPGKPPEQQTAEEAEKRKQVLEEAKRREERYLQRRREEARRRREQQEQQWETYASERASDAATAENDASRAEIEEARRRKAERLRQRRARMGGAKDRSENDQGRTVRHASERPDVEDQDPAARAPSEQESPAEVHAASQEAAFPRDTRTPAIDLSTATEAEKTRYYGRILGLRGRITAEDIKKSYRQLTAQYHPDKVGHLGEKLQKVAEEQTKQIIEAYEYFQKRFNI